MSVYRFHIYLLLRAAELHNTSKGLKSKQDNQRFKQCGEKMYLRQTLVMYCKASAVLKIYAITLYNHIYNMPKRLFICNKDELYRNL